MFEYMNVNTWPTSPIHLLYLGVSVFVSMIFFMLVTHAFFFQGVYFIVSSIVYVFICITCSALTLVTYLDDNTEWRKLWLIMFGLSVAMALTAAFLSCVFIPTFVDYFSQRMTLYVRSNL